MHPSKPIRPSDLAEGGAAGHVFNRQARRARASQEKSAARRASREQARADLVMRKVSDLTCAAVARDWENILIEHGVTILGDPLGGSRRPEPPAVLATVGQPGERRVVGDDVYEWVPDAETADGSGCWGRRLREGEIQKAVDIIVAPTVLLPNVTVRPMEHASDTTIGYRMTPDGKIGDPVCRFGVAGRVVDGEFQIDSVGMFPLEPGTTKESDPT